MPKVNRQQNIGHGIIALQYSWSQIMGLDARKPASGYANNKGADQHAHPRSLISAFVIILFNQNERS